MDEALSGAQATTSMEGIRKGKALGEAFLLDTFLWPNKEKYQERACLKKNKNGMASPL